MPYIKSFKKALNLNFLLVASIPVFLFGLINIQLVTKHQLEGVRERNRTQAHSIAEEVESFLLEVQADLLHVQQALSLDIVASEKMDSFLSGVVHNSRFFESIYVLDKELQVVNLGVLPTLEARRDDYRNLDLSGHQLFRQHRNITDSVWSNTFVSLTTGVPSVTLGLPMPQGFLLGDVQLNSLGKLLQRFTSNDELEVAIIDNRGTLVAHSITAKAIQRMNFNDHPAVLSAMQGIAVTQEYETAARRYLESAQQIPDSNWVVWVGLDMLKVQAPIVYMRNLLIAFMLITTTLASLFAYFNVRRLMHPLSALGNQASQIAEGHYAFQFRPSGLNEIDALAEQFTSMAHAIKVREESIITNEQRFRDLVNSIDGIVWEMEYPSFRFLFVSRQAETMLGYPVQTWYETADFWEQKTHAEDLEQAKAYCQLMSEKQEDHDFEYRMVAADGKIVWIRDLVTVVVEDRRPVRLLGVMIDVTTQKQLVDELSRSEQNYREIFNSTSDAIFIHDADSGQVLDVNQAMLNMFHCEYDQAIRGGIESFSQGLHPYTVDDGRKKFEETRLKGESTFEWRARKATGEIFWTEVHLRSAIIGNQPRILAAVRDISERKEAAEKIREANERVLLLIERMPIGCIFWTPEFTVELWNPEAETIFGFTVEEIFGRRPYGTIVPAHVEPDVEPIWARLLAGDKSANSVNENMKKSGEIITCEWSNTPVRDHAGEIIGVISMVQDISERKAAENELAQYRSQLEALVKERTRQLEIAQEELMQKERLAVLGRLTATVSHEIRNPLGTIANSLYLLKEALTGEQFEPLAKPLALAERNVERCDNIISELLDFSRQRAVKKTSLDLDGWLAELLHELSIPDDVECRLELATNNIVMADAERLRRAMVNVINNAFHALEAVSTKKKILLIKSRVKDKRYEILVIDNGCGMSEDVLARIFEPMFSTKNFGVGLGVPIIKNILESHGGGVKYESEVGVGTTVCMWLPIAEEC